MYSSYSFLYTPYQSSLSMNDINMWIKITVNEYFIYNSFTLFLFLIGYLSLKSRTTADLK